MDKDYSNLHRKLVLKYFWLVARRFKPSFFTVVFCTTLASLIDVYVPLQYLKLWNLLSVNNFEVAAEAQGVVLFILGLNVFRWIIRRVSGLALAHFEAEGMAGLREQAFSYMLGHSHSFFVNNFSGSLTQKINRYARSFEKLTDRMMVDGLPLLVRGVGTVIAVYTFLPKYSYILAGFCALFLVTSFVYIRFKIKYDVIAAAADSKTTGAFSDAIGNHSSIQYFTSKNYETEKARAVVGEQKDKVKFNWFLWEGVGAVGSFYAMAVEFIIFWVALRDWKLSLIGLPQMVLLQSYLIRLIDNLWSFAAIVRAYYESFADAEEMAVILNAPYEIEDIGTKKLENIKGEILFEEVTYVYENNLNKVLDNFSLFIPSGQKIALVGSSGAGKTTFVRLLMRFFEVTAGRIKIDGIDIRDISQENLRENISFVPQDPVLFHRSLMDNIRYGRRDATDQEVFEAARLAHCDEFIKALPLGYGTFVGERGVKLSGGERQRVAIARAILKNSPILILDEATSSLDSKSEHLIQDALSNLLEGKTAIVIAHRLSTIREMDRIIVLEKGKIVQDGSHEVLAKIDGGLYKKLWDLQAGGFQDIP